MVEGPEALDQLLQLARQAGFSKEKFDKCLADKELFNKIVDERQRAHDKFGVELDAELLRQRQAAGRRASAQGFRGADDRRAEGRHERSRRPMAPRPRLRAPTPEGETPAPEAASPPERRRNKRAERMLLRAARVSIALALAGLLAGCGGVAGGRQRSADKALDGIAAGRADGRRPARRAGRSGKAERPVTVIEYVSLTCPHCANFQKALFPRFKKEFIDTGKVRFIVREFPIGHTSGNAALVNRCAPEDKYFFLLNQFLTRQSEWVSQEVRPDAIYSVAKSSGMTRETFDKCLSNQTIIDGLTEVKQRGRQIRRDRHADLLHQWPQGAQGEVTFDEIKAMIEQAPPPPATPS